MKKTKLILLLLSILIIFILVIRVYLFYSGDKRAEKKHFADQLGTYVLDISKTILGTYAKDSALYKKLQLEFFADSSFKMNMKVPFIFDSAGKWKAGEGGLEDWNRLYYKSWNYKSFDKNSGNQFDQCCLPDSTFYINGATPQTGEQFIQEIYFKKIKKR